MRYGNGTVELIVSDDGRGQRRRRRQRARARRHARARVRLRGRARSGAAGRRRLPAPCDTPGDVNLDETGATTLTFLFTDIEGSTALLRRLRDGYGAVFEDHRRLLRDAWEAHGGRELDNEGDSFFVAFRRPRQAVDAAVAAQRALAGHPWPDGRRRARPDRRAHRRGDAGRRPLRRPRRPPRGSDLRRRPRRAGAALGDDALAARGRRA